MPLFMCCKEKKAQQIKSIILSTQHKWEDNITRKRTGYLSNTTVIKNILFLCHMSISFPSDPHLYVPSQSLPRL